MTLKELSQLYWLNREIENDYARLEQLRSEAYGVGSARGDGMPHGTEPGRTTEGKAVAIAQAENVIREKLTRIQQEQLRLMTYINTVEDSLTRQIYILRFVGGLTWEQVAARIGGGNTGDSVRMACYRYMRKNQ